MPEYDFSQYDNDNQNYDSDNTQFESNGEKKTSIDDELKWD
jgi:hypothetical protein